MLVRRLLLGILLTTWGLLVAPVILAQTDANMVTAGETVTGTIDDDNYFDLWRYDSDGNETLTVSIETFAGDLDSTLAVMAEDYSVFSQNDDDFRRGTTDSAVEGIFLPEAISVIIVVSRSGGELGLTSGRYRMTLDAQAGDIRESLRNSPNIALDEAQITGTPDEAINHLIALGIIPSTAYDVGVVLGSTTFIETSGTNSILFYPVGRDYQAANVVIHTNIEWIGNDETMACGVVFRTQVNSSFDAYVVYLSRQGWAELGYLPGGQGANYETLERWRTTGIDTNSEGINNLLITAVNEEITISVNYELIARTSDFRLAEPGEFYISTLKQPNQYVRCNFRDYWAAALLE